MSQQQGKVGNVQVLNSMQAAVQQQRVAGQVTVPIQWVDSWIAQLQADYGYGYQQTPYAYLPNRSYSTFFDAFHPVDTFMPLFSDNFTVRTTTTLK